MVGHYMQAEYLPYWTYSLQSYLLGCAEIHIQGVKCDLECAHSTCPKHLKAAALFQLIQLPSADNYESWENMTFGFKFLTCVRCVLIWSPNYILPFQFRFLHSSFLSGIKIVIPGQMTRYVFKKIIVTTQAKSQEYVRSNLMSTEVRT